jgi:ribosome biogenesis GTPase
MTKGRVIKNYNGFYYVSMGKPDLVECRRRGKLKHAGRILVGDFVEVTLLTEMNGVIEQCYPRINEIRRPELANIDQMFIIMAAKSPDPNRFLVDKLLMTCEYARIPVQLCLNKCELDRESANAYRSFYETCGYKTHLISAHTGEGLADLETVLDKKMSAFAGPSGVGKSSLLSRILGRDDLSVGHVSQKIQRGRHTTRHSVILPLKDDTFVVDTPGFSSLDFEFMESRELIHLFPDMLPYSQGCRFSSCLHRTEPDCQLKEAVQAGQVQPERYNTYLKILETILERKR